MSDCFDHAFDAYDDLCFGRTSDEGYYSYRSTMGHTPYTPQCKFCGSVDVQWIETAAGWRLYNDNGARHECNRGSADDFEDLDG